MLVRPPRYLYYTKCESYSNNSDIKDGPKVDNKIPMTDGLLSTNLSYTEIENYNDNSEISNKVGNRVGNEVFFMEEIQPNHFNSNHPKSKYYGNNGKNNNRNIWIGGNNKEF